MAALTKVQILTNEVDNIQSVFYGFSNTVMFAMWLKSCTS